MEKAYEQVKKGLKKSLKEITGKDVGVKIRHKPNKEVLEVHISVDYDVPEGFEQIKDGMDVDQKQPEIVSFMREKESKLMLLLNECYKDTAIYEKESDFNFTLYFPEILRLSISNKDRESKSDEELINEGYFEFRETESVGVLDGLVMKKYAGIRARYSFLIPSKNLIALG